MEMIQLPPPGKDKRKFCGVYLVRHLATGFFLVGSSKNLYDRQSSHLSKLRMNVHPCKQLQEAFLKDQDVEFLAHVCEDKESADALEAKLLEEYEFDPLFLNVVGARTFQREDRAHAYAHIR